MVTCFFFLYIYVDKTYWPHFVLNIPLNFALGSKVYWHRDKIVFLLIAVVKEVYSLVYTGSTLQFLGSLCLLFLLLVHTVRVAVFIVEDVQCSGTGASQFLYSIYIVQNERTSF